MKKKRTKDMALCGVFTALGLVILLFTAIPVTEISLAVLAGMTVVPVVIECGKKAGVLSFLAVSLLSLFLVPSLEGKGLYIAFFGYYGIVKALLERHSLPFWAEWGIKLGLFNLAMVSLYWILLRFFSLEADSFTIAGISLPWVFLLLGNGVFLVYDWCLTRLIGVYLIRFQPRIQRLFKH